MQKITVFAEPKSVFLPPNTTIILCGVSGSGKSTVGPSLAQAFGTEFIEGEKFHSPLIFRKLEAHIELSENEWLEWIEECAEGVLNKSTCVLAHRCMLESHRDKFREILLPRQNCLFIQLNPDFELLKERVLKLDNMRFPIQIIQRDNKEFEPLSVDEFVNDSMVVKSTERENAVADSVAAVHEVLASSKFSHAAIVNCESIILPADVLTIWNCVVK